MAKFATIGVDIGGTKTRLALFDEKFRVIQDAKFKTRATEGEKRFRKDLQNSLTELLTRADKTNLKLLALGIGAAGTPDPQRGAFKTSSVPFRKDFPLVSLLNKSSGVPVCLGNDVHMGIYGEHQLGAAVGLQHVIGVFFGTGLGAGLILHGKLYGGANGTAGDIGHYLIAPMGPLAGSEAEGTLNDLMSRGALAGKAAMLATRGLAPYLLKKVGTEIMAIRSGELSESIVNGDKEVERMIRSRARMTGIALSNFVDLLNPEMVVLGGGLVEAMPALFLKEVEAGIREHTVLKIQRACRVVVSKLKKYAVAAGAAKMAWDTLVRSASQS